MSQVEIHREFLYKLPASVMNSFTRVMDALPHADWMLFASRVVSDQTELRLLEKHHRRTDALMHKWGTQNGTVGELVKILEDLQYFRACDIILQSRHSSPPDLHSSPSVVSPSTASLTCHDVTPLLEVSHLPKPSPPPSHLDSRVSETDKDECQNRDDLPSFSIALNWPFEEIQKGTCHFSPCKLIGEGGFGHVYKALMRNTEFAVKKLKEDSELDWKVVKESFQTEVEMLSRYRHPNIMDFVGYSIEGPIYCLLYVYMPNGSLEDRLHAEDCALSWTQRVQVLLGLAKAVQFLHSFSPVLIHGDIKSSNVLLGNHLEPKLGDFGLARLCRNPEKPAGKTSSMGRTSTVRGTLAYLPDEYLKDGRLGPEIDVYSFGVVALEILTGRKALVTDAQSRSIYLKDIVDEEEAEEDGGSFSRRKTSQETFTVAAENICRKYTDARLIAEPQSVRAGSVQVAELACRCLHQRRKRRPRMSDVFTKLQELHVELEDSKQPAAAREPLVSSHPSVPAPLRSENCAADSLSQRISQLLPRENTSACLHNPTLPVSPSVPCESDESQGFSQYDVHSAVNPPHEGVSSQNVFINPARRRLVQKIELYEEGMMCTSDLLSSSQLLHEGMSSQTREPEESDEFAC